MGASGLNQVPTWGIGEGGGRKCRKCCSPAFAVFTHYFMSEPVERGLGYRFGAGFHAGIGFGEKFGRHTCQLKKCCREQQVQRCFVKARPDSGRKRRLQDKISPMTEAGEAAKKAMRAWEADPRAARATWRWATRVELGEILEGLQQGLPPAQQTLVTVAIAVEVREALRKRKLDKKL